MDTKILAGNALAETIREETRASVEKLRAQGIPPRLAAVMADPDPATLNYAESKSRMASGFGITCDLVVLPPGDTQQRLETALAELAANPAIHGIILELPLPPGFDVDRALNLIPPHKDIDGLTSANLGLLYAGREAEALVAATSQACILLAESALKEEGRGLSGARVGVVGKGRTVGAPLIAMLLNRQATVTVCHSKTADLAESLRDCDIVFAAAGKTGLLDRAILREGQMVIDAGMTIVDGKARGDVDMESARGLVRALTPVPQGVGPVTTALIFKNLLKAIQFQSKA